MTSALKESHSTNWMKVTVEFVTALDQKREVEQKYQDYQAEIIQQYKHFEEQDNQQLEELEVEDKVWAINNIGETDRIYVIHQIAQRQLRRDIIVQMKKLIKEVDGVDLEDLTAAVETEAEVIETNLMKYFAEWPAEDANKIPVFNFELN